MVTAQPPQVALQEFLAATTHHTRRVEIYESDGVTRWSKDTESRLIDGTVNVDYDRDERRTIDLLLANDDGVLVNAPGEFWYDKIIKVFRGVRVKEQDRSARIVIISDKQNEFQLAQTFRSRLVQLGFGDVRIDNDSTTWADIADFDIVVGLGSATTGQIELLKQAYRSGKSVFVQDRDAYDWMMATYSQGVDFQAPTKKGIGNIVQRVDESTHPVSSGWQPFEVAEKTLNNTAYNAEPRSANGTGVFRTNLATNPNASNNGSYLLRYQYMLSSGGMQASLRSGDGPEVTPGVYLVSYVRRTITDAISNYTGPFYSENISGVAGDRYTGSAFVRLSADAVGYAYVQFLSAGLPVGETQIPLNIKASDGWVRIGATAEAEGSFTQIRVGYMATNGRPLSSTVDMTAVLIEKSSHLDSYFNGSSAPSLRLNLAYDSIPASLSDYSWYGAGATASGSFIQNAADGPVTDGLNSIPKYIRWSYTTASSGSSGFTSSAVPLKNAFGETVTFNKGEVFTASVYMRSSARVRVYMVTYGSGDNGRSEEYAGEEIYLEPGVWQRVAGSPFEVPDALQKSIGWYTVLPDSVKSGTVIEITGAMVERSSEVGPFFGYNYGVGALVSAKVGNYTLGPSILRTPLVTASWEDSETLSGKSYLSTSVPKYWSSSSADMKAYMIVDEDGTYCAEVSSSTTLPAEMYPGTNAPAQGFFQNQTHLWAAFAVDIKPIGVGVESNLRLKIKIKNTATSAVLAEATAAVSGAVSDQWSRHKVVLNVPANMPSFSIYAYVEEVASAPIGVRYRLRRSMYLQGQSESDVNRSIDKYTFNPSTPDTVDVDYTTSLTDQFVERQPRWGYDFIFSNSEATPIGTVSSTGGRNIHAFTDRLSGGRAISASFTMNRDQYDVPQFANFLKAAFQWLDTFQPMTHWETQVGEFMIDRISEKNYPHTVKITGRDYTKKCINSKYLFATQFATGMALETIVATIAAAAGIVKRNLPNTGVVVGREFYFDSGVTRWDAMKEVASAYNYELYFDASGYLTMRPYLDPATSAPSIWLDTGAEGKLSTFDKSTSDSRLYNVVIVRGESSDANTPNVYAIARNEDPNSPTSIQKIGERVYEYTSSFITTQAQAQSVANSFLAVHALEEYELGFEALMLPWLEVGEIVGFMDPRRASDDPQTFLLSSINIGLKLGPMSGTAKRVTKVI